MKLVLKFNDITKLYADELDFSQIISFIEREINLEAESITISYTDPEGDQIVVGSNQDLAIMEALLEDKSYVKIEVGGSLKQMKDIDRNLCCRKLQENQVQIKVEEPPKSPSKPEQNKEVKKDQQKKKIQIEAKPTQKSQQKIQVQKLPQKKKQKEGLKANGDKKKIEKIQKVDKNFESFNRLISQAISSLVDERVKSLIPCIKEQAISKQLKASNDEIRLVHKGYSCQVCLINPIIGVRYQCPKCQLISVCQQCELAYDHQHNLIKIKKIEEQSSPAKLKAIKQLYDTFFKDKNAIKEAKKEVIKEETITDQKIKRYCRQLKLVFGGKVADYTSIVESNLEAPLPRIVEQYCAASNIPKEEGSRKYKQDLFQRLRKRFTKVDPADLAVFIQDNITLQCKDIMKLYAQRLVKLAAEKKANKKKVAGKSQQKAEEVKQQKMPIIEEIPKQPVQKCVKLSSIAEKKENNEPKSLLEADKRVIYDLMLEFYGEERAAEFPAFIEKHYKLKKEDIIQLWSDKMSSIYA